MPGAGSEHRARAMLVFRGHPKVLRDAEPADTLWGGTNVLNGTSTRKARALPPGFSSFRLAAAEVEAEPVANATSQKPRHALSNPYALTEHGRSWHATILEQPPRGGR